MSMTVKSQIEEVLTRIQHIQEHTKHVHRTLSFIQNRDNRARVEAENTIRLLCDMELDQWRNLMMWALRVDDDMRARIGAAAYQRFLSDGMHVVEHFTGCQTPGQWLAATEAEFRKMARETFVGCTAATETEKDARIDRLEKALYTILGMVEGDLGSRIDEIAHKALNG